METLFNNTNAFGYSWKPVDLIHEDPEKKSRLFLGNIGSFSDKNFLMENKIKAIASILQEPISEHSKDFITDHIHISIPDSEKSDILVHLDSVLEFIQKNMDNGNSVLVHCMAGSSRSASFVIAYLMKRNQWCFEKAYCFAKEKRPQVFPNSGFMRQLRIYEKTLFEKEKK